MIQTRAHEARAQAIGQLATATFDLLVVGGGITGTGTALDAATRGLRVALIEADDLAVGTSSRSSKLIHGGLRYLDQLRFGLVREALAERATLARIAPHLVRLEPFLVPVHGLPHRVPYYGAGLTLYGLLGSSRGAGFPRYLGPARARLEHPALKASGLRGAWAYHDGIEDDARFVVAVARTAMAAGTVIVTRMRAVELSVTGGRADGAIVEDALTGERHLVRAASVVDATGVTGGDGGPFGLTPSGATMPSRGIHLVVPRSRIPGSSGLTIRIPGRVVFLIPWGNQWIVGTTDHDHTGSTERPQATGAEVHELLAALNGVLDVGLDRSDVVATFAGIRPLVGGGGSTVTASREHRIGSPMPGVFTVRGGKFTTYRRMAEQIVDRVRAASGQRTGPSVTSTTPLIGAGPSAVTARGTVAQQAPGEMLPGHVEVDPPTLAHLHARYGSEADAVLALGRERGLLRRLHRDALYLEAEVAWAVERELAISLDDILARRLRLAFEVRDHGASVAERVATIASASSSGGLPSDISAARAAAADYADAAQREYGVPR